MYVDIYKGRVYAPDDYKILDDTLDAGVCYAGIVAEKYNSIPHFIFFQVSQSLNLVNWMKKEYINCAQL